jgi:HNH endonuclease
MLRYVKRAIFRKRSIDVCVDEQVLATPIGPAALMFSPGEDVVVAVPKNTTAAAGEYQFLFRVETYLGEDAQRAEKLFGRPSWRHFYRLGSATSISPFSLDDVIAFAGVRGSEIWERYHGQTQHHRIIRHIQLEDEPLFRHFINRATEPVWVPSAVVEANAVATVRRRVRKRSKENIVRRLLVMDRQSRNTPPGKQYRPGRSQKRNAEFSELVRALYDDRCQVCGIQLLDVEGVPRRSQVHHFEPWNGDRSDRIDNVICVCPNDHARFEIGVLRWANGELYEWDESWRTSPLAVDVHLAVRLRVAAFAGGELRFDLSNANARI